MAFNELIEKAHRMRNLFGEEHEWLFDRPMFSRYMSLTNEINNFRLPPESNFPEYRKHIFSTILLEKYKSIINHSLKLIETTYADFNILNFDTHVINTISNIIAEYENSIKEIFTQKYKEFGIEIYNLCYLDENKGFIGLHRKKVAGIYLSLDTMAQCPFYPSLIVKTSNIIDEFYNSLKISLSEMAIVMITLNGKLTDILNRYTDKYKKCHGSQSEPTDKESIIEKIFEMIENDDVENTFEFIKLFITRKSDNYNDIILIKRKITENNNNFNKGIIDYETFTKMKNIITNSLIQILTESINK